VADVFLHAVDVHTEQRAMIESLKSALGRNKTYCEEADDQARTAFRNTWATLLRSESVAYSMPVSDEQHCATIRRISDLLSNDYGRYLVNGRLRYGTSQKALNLYLKYLWRLGIINVPPPHCPIDAGVLAAAGIDGAWTKCDSIEQYMEWITRLKTKAAPFCLADWEYNTWLPSR